MKLRSTTRWLAAGAGAAAASYGVYASVAWLRYGHAAGPRTAKEADPLLDRFMPDYDIVERHSIRVAAPPEATFAAACEMDLQESAILRAIFRARELVLGAQPVGTRLPQGLLAQTKALGWGALAEEPGREIVMGAVTRPWEANPRFRALPPEEFAAFSEPGYVKIAWTLRVDPAGAAASVHRTETRAVATDGLARRKFRRYWAAVSPGIVLIRRIAVRLVKRRAERISSCRETGKTGR